jgi:hypothetical protein
MSTVAGDPQTDRADERPARSRAIPITIIVLATLIGLVSVFGLWVKRQALETETFAETSAELLENEEIRNSVADFVVATIYENVDVDAAVADRLPPQLESLAAPAAAGLRRLATTVTQDLLEQPKVQDLWREATGAAQERLIALLEDEGEFVATTGGTVTLDLTGLVGEAAAQIGIGGDVASKLPPEASQIEIMHSDELSAAQTGVKALRTLAWVLSALTLLLYGLAIALARGRRRETLRAVGFSFAFVGVVVFLTRNVAANVVTDALASNASAEPAVDAAWGISTSLLEETAQSLIAYGVVIVLAAWLAGPTAIATSIRHAITPYLRRPLVAYAGVATILALLFWWDPVVATHRLVPSLLLALLLVIGVEALRRQVIREFPDHVERASAAGIGESIKSRAGRLRGGTPTGPPAPDEPAADDRLGQLERLARLREAGVLDDAELAGEKRRILAATGGSPPADPAA